jgi:hypothetical protein
VKSFSYKTNNLKEKIRTISHCYFKHRLNWKTSSHQTILMNNFTLLKRITQVILILVILDLTLKVMNSKKSFFWKAKIIIAHTCIKRAVSLHWLKLSLLMSQLIKTRSITKKLKTWRPSSKIMLWIMWKKNIWYR